MEPLDPLLLTVPEAAKVLHLGRSKVCALIRTGELPSFRIGRARRIHVDALREFAARLMTNGAR